MLHAMRITRRSSLVHLTVIAWIFSSVRSAMLEYCVIYILTMNRSLMQVRAHSWSSSHRAHLRLLSRPLCYIKAWPPTLCCTVCDTGYHTPYCVIYILTKHRSLMQVLVQVRAHSGSCFAFSAAAGSLLPSSIYKSLPANYTLHCMRYRLSHPLNCHGGDLM